MNLLYLVCDQLQAQCLGFMGHPCAQTPNLDRLANEGVVFDQAYTPSPVCMAARGSLLTGRYPATCGIHGMGLLPPWETTTATVLKQNGYTTGAFGKTHITPELYTREVLNSDVPILDWKPFLEHAAIPDVADDPNRRQYGFDEHVGCDDANRGNHRRWLADVAPELLDRKPEHPCPAPGDLWVSPFPSEYHHTTFIANQTTEFINQQPQGTPWFAFCGFIHPHHPFEAPQDQIDRYDPDGIPLPRIRDGVDPQCIPKPMAGAIDETDRLGDDAVRRIILHYLASISLIDDAVGQLVETLEQTGQREDTVIVFTSDHGEFLGERKLVRKPSLHYDELIRVPLLVAAPGVDQRRVDGLVELTDLHPTVLGLLGIDRNPGVQGVDWSDALLDTKAIGRDDIYSDMYNLGPLHVGAFGGPYGAVRTLRTTTWKLNIFPEGAPDHGQLFDLANDPQELNNLYADPEYRDVRENMLWRLLQRIDENRDPLPLRLSQW